jgi:hypothetical protein
LAPGPSPPSYRDTLLICPLLSLSIAGERGEVTVSWTITTGASEYFLEEDDHPDFFTPIQVYQGAGTTVMLGQLERLRPWYFRVRAANRLSTSPWSNIVGYTATTKSSPAPVPSMSR